MESSRTSMAQLRVITVLVLVALTSAQVDLNDLTLQPGTHGQQVVEAAVRAIFDQCVFNDDFRFLRRMAYVITHDGDKFGTYDPVKHSGGIWQISEGEFRATQHSSSLVFLNSHYPGFSSAFNINWASVKYEDLDKPFYSALAAMITTLLYTSGVSKVSIADQASVYRDDFGHPYDDYIKGVKDLEQYEKTCLSQLLDIAFILDASGSVVPADFTRSKSFAAEIAGGFDVAPDKVRVAVLTFSSDVQKEFDFTAHQSSSAVKAAISAVTQSGQGTATHLALDYASSTLFTASSGARSNTAKVAVVITDGTSINTTLTSQAAARLKAANVEVYVFGIGQTLYQKELDGMASPPTCTHVKVIRQFSDLVSIQSDITRRSCEAAVVQPPNSNINYTCGIPQTIKIFPGPETTIKVTPTDGQVKVYTSFTSAQPNAAKNLLSTVATKYRPLVLFIQNTSSPLYLTLDTSGQCNGSVSLDISSGTSELSKLGTTTKCIINKVLVPCPDWVFLKRCRLFPIIHGDVAFLTYPNPCKNDEMAFYSYPFSIYWFVYCTGNQTLLECRCPPGQSYSGYASNCIPTYTLDPSDPCNGCDQSNWDVGLHKLHISWDSGKYVQCSGVYSCTVQTCGTNSRFDQAKQSCVAVATLPPPTTAVPTTPVPTTTTTTTTTTTAPPRPTLASVHCETGLNAQTYFPYFGHADKYIHCESGIAYVKDCPPATSWDQGTLKCE